MRGASALGQLLEAEPDKKLHVLVLWMPVLNTDFGPPSTEKLALVPGRRVAQFWDPKHVVSKTLEAAARAHPEWLTADEKAFLEREGFVVWDYVAVYPPGVRWDKDVPRPDFRGGPVWKMADGLRERLQQIR